MIDFNQITIKKSQKIAIFHQKIKYFFFKGKEKILVWTNTNKLLNSKYCLGLKTGITPSAGPCFSSYFEVQNYNFVIIVFKTEKTEGRFNECLKLLEYLCFKLNICLDHKEFHSFNF